MCFQQLLAIILFGVIGSSWTWEVVWLESFNFGLVLAWYYDGFPSDWIHWVQWWKAFLEIVFFNNFQKSKTHTYLWFATLYWQEYHSDYPEHFKDKTIISFHTGLKISCSYWSGMASILKLSNHTSYMIDRSLSLYKKTNV